MIHTQNTLHSKGIDMITLPPIVGGDLFKSLISNNYPKCYLINSFQEPISVPISNELFNHVRSAKKNLSSVVLIEQAYDEAMENYVEYEVELLHEAARDDIFGKQDEEEFKRVLRKIGRRIDNHLSSIHRYRAHSIKLTAPIFGKNAKEYAAHKEAFEKAERNNKHFRDITHLRDHALHAGIVATNVTFKRGWQEVEDHNSKLRSMIVPQLLVSEVRQGRRMKEIFADLDEKDKIDLREYIRGHLEGIWEIHSWLRSMLKDRIKTWEATLRTISDMYLAHLTTDKSDKDALWGLLIYQWNPRMKSLDVAERLHLPYLFSYKQLMAKNRSLVNLRRRYVSNELTED